MSPQKTLAIAVAALWVAACNVPPPEQELGTTQSEVKSTGPVCQGGPSVSGGSRDDNGTELSATGEVASQECNSDGSATITLSGVVTSTGSRDSVEIYLSVDGGAEALVHTIQPQDFSNDGRVKTAAYSITVNLGSGTHSLMLCFVQSGSQGRQPKRFCLPAPISVIVDCNRCSNEAPFGDIVGNPSLCTGRGDLTIPVHVKGDFGDLPSIRITGPNDYSLNAFMRRAGDSCVYHYDWKPASAAGPGTYTFFVQGNGKTLTFTANLRCPGRDSQQPGSQQPIEELQQISPPSDSM